MDEKVEEMFSDADSLHQEAIKEFEEGRIRDAAEKAWGATLRATNALILAREGKEIEGAIGTSKELHALAVKDGEIDRKLVGRYYTRESYLHGQCFYMGNSPTLPLDPLPSQNPYWQRSGMFHAGSLSWGGVGPVKQGIQVK